MFHIDSQQNFYNLSRGQKIKATFALLAAKKPNIYILDEITAVLDIGSRLSLIQFLQKETETRNASVVIATNIATEIPNHNTHIYLLSHAQIKLDCAADSLSSIFKKYISTNNEEDQMLYKIGATLIATNYDGSKSFLLA